MIHKPIKSLSAREKDVLILIERGLTSKEVAHQLLISRHSVETHKRRMMDKFQVTNVPSLGGTAIRLGLI